MATKDVTDIDVVRAAATPDRRAIEVLMEATGQPRKVCLRALERAQLRGLIDCGVSIASAWPTDAGRALLGDNNVELTHHA